VGTSLKYGGGVPDTTKMTPEDQNILARSQLSAVTGLVNPEAVAFGGMNAGVRDVAKNLLRKVDKVADATPAAERYYHGTGGGYDTPDASQFDPTGLFGPGYYLTDNPRVASSYAEGATGEVVQAMRDLDALQHAKKTGLQLSGITDVDTEIATAERHLASLDSGASVRPVDVPSNLTEQPEPVGRRDARGFTHLHRGA
jgi:hypothetical protein